MSDQKTLGQVAFEAFVQADQYGYVWERERSYLRQNWEHAAQAVVERVIVENDEGLDELKEHFKSRGAAEERERLIALFEAHPLEDWTSRELVQILRCNGGKP